jgi:hypothetical protein
MNCDNGPVLNRVFYRLSTGGRGPWRVGGKGATGRRFKPFKTRWVSNPSNRRDDDD